MIIVDATAISFFVTTVLALAALGAVVALAAVAEFVVGNRHTRVARHQSVRTYYRGLALSH